MTVRPERNYVYDAKIIKAYDGDSFHALIDQGFRDYTTRRLRLSRVDTPEMRTPTLEEGRMVRDEVRNLILDKDVRIQTFQDKTGSWNRYIAEVWIGDVNLSDWLLEMGYAIIFVK